MTQTDSDAKLRRFLNRIW